MQFPRSTKIMRMLCTVIIILTWDKHKFLSGVHPSMTSIDGEGLSPVCP